MCLDSESEFMPKMTSPTQPPCMRSYVTHCGNVQIFDSEESSKAHHSQDIANIHIIGCSFTCTSIFSLS